MLREKLTEGETNPLWLSEPLSHLLPVERDWQLQPSGFLLKREVCARARVYTHMCAHLCGGC